MNTNLSGGCRRAEESAPALLPSDSVAMQTGFAGKVRAGWCGLRAAAS